jgi:hypothetical protein
VNDKHDITLLESKIEIWKDPTKKGKSVLKQQEKECMRLTRLNVMANKDHDTTSNELNEYAQHNRGLKELLTSKRLVDDQLVLNKCQHTQQKAQLVVEKAQLVLEHMCKTRIMGGQRLWIISIKTSKSCARQEEGSDR